MVFGALVFKLSVWCGAGGCVSGLRAAAAAAGFVSCTATDKSLSVHISNGLFYHVLLHTYTVSNWDSTCIL